MYSQVKLKIDELSVLILHPDIDSAQQLANLPDLSSFAAVAASITNARYILQNDMPQVIIANDASDDTLNLFQEIATGFALLERPVMISISDIPPYALFEVADQIVPYCQLPYIGQIVATQLLRREKTTLLEKQCAELEANNRQLNADLDFYNRTSTELNLLKQAIVHSVSHELRTPMLQVKSAVALLNEDESTNRNIVELAMGATTRLEGGIRNVTLLNELMNESSNVDSFNIIPIIQIIQAALRNLGRSWEHKQAINRVEIVPNTSNLCVLCERQRLSIAIQLLLDNALKFSQDKVIVSITNTGEKVSISIQDTGIGIPPSQIEKIYEAFYQVDGSSTRRFGGMGIGLAIVRLILEQHFSTIQVHSVEGKGSIFSFELPIRESGDDYSREAALA